MSNIFFVSDTHFGHTRVLQYSSRNFADVNDMNEKMVQAWNEVVKPQDIVHHLGDFSFQKWDEFSKFVWRLNGKIHLKLGNHDKMIIQHKDYLLSKGKFATIRDYEELKINGQLIILFHYGMRVWRNSHHGSIMCYGHSHGSLPPHGKSVDVGVDCKEITHEYRPIHLDELLTYMSKRQGEVVDHHGMKEED